MFEVTAQTEVTAPTEATAPTEVTGAPQEEAEEIRFLVRRLVAVLTARSRTVASLSRDSAPAADAAHLLDIEVDGVRCRCSWVTEPAGSDIVALSPREQEITRMVAKGHTNQAIADVLGISAWTVSTHLRRVFGKLGVNSRAAMVAQVLNSGAGLTGLRSIPPK